MNVSGGNWINIGDDMPGHDATLIIDASQQLPYDNVVNTNLDVGMNGNLILAPGVNDTVTTLYMQGWPHHRGPEPDRRHDHHGRRAQLMDNTNFTLYQLGASLSDPTAATISGGTLSFNPYGASGTRTVTMSIPAAVANDTTNANGDLNISSAIVDGSNLINTNITKQGLGTLVLSGSTANTFSGITTLNEGMIVFAKSPDGTTAIGGPLQVGSDAIPFAGEGNGSTSNTGYSSTQQVQFRGNNQMLSNNAFVVVKGTGYFNLNGYNQTIGVANLENALSSTTAPRSRPARPAPSRSMATSLPLRTASPTTRAKHRSFPAI